LSFPISENKATSYFDLVPYDIWGTYRIESLRRPHYFLSNADDASRGTWVFFMKEKSEASPTSWELLHDKQNPIQCTIKTIQSDNGSEFTLGPM